MVTDVVYVKKDDLAAAAEDLDGGGDYDDEYDDTYDDNAVGQEEPDAADSDRGGGGRAFVLPRVLGGGHVRSAQPPRREQGCNSIDIFSSLNLSQNLQDTLSNTVPSHA